MRLTAAGLALASLWLVAAKATAVDLRAKTVSSSKQFVVFCSDVGLRGQVASFVEDVKGETLRLLGEPDRWKIPVVISLDLPSADSATRPPVSLRLEETLQGPKIEIDVLIGDDPAAVHLQKHIVRAVLLEMAYRDRKVQGGQPMIEPPWWIVAGMLESFRRQDLGVDSELFTRLDETNRMQPIDQFLAQHVEDLGGAVQALDGACAMALLQLLLEQPAGRD